MWPIVVVCVICAGLLCVSGVGFVVCSCVLTGSCGCFAGLGLFSRVVVWFLTCFGYCRVWGCSVFGVGIHWILRSVSLVAC